MVNKESECIGEEFPYGESNYCSGLSDQIDESHQEHLEGDTNSALCCPAPVINLKCYHLSPALCDIGHSSGCSDVMMV